MMTPCSREAAHGFTDCSPQAHIRYCLDRHDSTRRDIVGRRTGESGCQAVEEPAQAALRSVAGYRAFHVSEPLHLPTRYELVLPASTFNKTAFVSTIYNEGHQNRLGTVCHVGATGPSNATETFTKCPQLLAPSQSSKVSVISPM